MLMNDELLLYYPVIKDNTTNFVRYYLDHFEKIDRAFYLRYATCEPILIDEKQTFPSIYNEWVENCNAFILYYMDSWARLFYGLNIDYNPIHNYDGKMTTTTVGQTERTSGSDMTTIDYGGERTSGTDTTTIDYGKEKMTNNLGKQKTTDTYGATHTNTINSEIPYDMETYKNTSKSEVNGDGVTNTTDIDAVSNTSEKDAKQDKNTLVYSAQKEAKQDRNTVVYGKQNDVNYTVTEEKGGNLGVTSTQTMLLQEYELRLKSFFDNLFTTISRELLIR